MEDTVQAIIAGGHAPASRRRFLKTIGVGLAALAVTAADPISEGIAFANDNLQGLTDLDILNFALTLEHLEAVFYITAVNSGKLTGTRLTRTIRTIRDHEVAHVNTLTQVIRSLGGKPVARQARYNFGSFGNQDVILKTAETLEAVGVGAYTGAAALITNKATLLAAAGSIEQVESRHLAAIRFLRGNPPAPGPLGEVLTVPQVLKAVTPILGS